MNKKYLLLVILVVITVLLGLYTYTKTTYNNHTVTNIDKHLTTNEKLRDINFCGKTYKMNQILFDGNDVGQKIAEIINYNYNNDTFPKPGSGNDIYKDMTEFSQNMRYSFRPYMIVKNTCSTFEKSTDTKALDFQNIRSSGLDYTFSINGIIFTLRNLPKITQVYIDDPKQDTGGLGGAYEIQLPK